MSDLYNSNLFITPVWDVYDPSFVKPLIRATDSYIKEAKKRNQKFIKDRNKSFKTNVGDLGLSHHSTKLYNDPRFEGFINVVTDTSFNFLDAQGFDLTNHTLTMNELWVQEFASKGGHHVPHAHWNQHVSGFYFLKCSDKTSFPIFHDPRPGALMTKLPLKKDEKIHLGGDAISFKVKPGTFIFFPGYLTHEFSFDLGIDKFRFIHFNMQAVHSDIVK
jgi:uncharacterized protein (TIGR02466 family)|tara:strand:+ start:397 stop:1050 length:654 start_codon:yes stop_codon:yes gene_type:complete